MSGKYNNKITTVIIIPTGKTVDLSDFIDMVLDYEEKENLRVNKPPPEE